MTPAEILAARIRAEQDRAYLEQLAAQRRRQEQAAAEAAQARLAARRRS